MKWKQRSPGQTCEGAAGSTDRGGHEPRSASASGSDKGRGQRLLQRLQKECRPTDIVILAEEAEVSSLLPAAVKYQPCCSKPLRERGLVTAAIGNDIPFFQRKQGVQKS